MPDPDRVAFYRAIADAPDDDVPRLVFADWLQERGEDARAEFIRLQCAIAQAPTDEPDLPAMRARERELLLDHESRWRAELPTVLELHWGEFRRGFVTQATARNLTEFARNAGRIFADTPIHSLTLAAPLTVRQAETLARLPPWAELTEFRLASPVPCGDEPVAILAGSPHFNRLRSLELAGQGLTDATVAKLAGLPRLRGLRRLDLSANALETPAAEALAASPSMTELRSLSLFRNRIGDRGLIALVRSDRLRHVESLEVQNDAIFDAGIEALAASDWIGRMERLNLSYNHVGDRGAKALAGCRHLANLRALILRSNRIGDAGAIALAGSPFADGLASLELGSNRIGERGRAALTARFGDRAAV